MLVRLRQRANALLPMLATPLVIVTFVRPVHKENASLPILVTLAGIVRVVTLPLF